MGHTEHRVVDLRHECKMYTLLLANLFPENTAAIAVSDAPCSWA
jgi:hypothetical protein